MCSAAAHMVDASDIHMVHTCALYVVPQYMPLKGLSYMAHMMTVFVFGLTKCTIL